MKFSQALLVILVTISSLHSPSALCEVQSKELEFDTSLELETPLIDFGIAKFVLVGEIDLSPNFILTSFQNQKHAESSDTINLSLLSEGFTGHLTLSAYGENGNKIVSQTIPFHFEESPLGDVVLLLPEVGLQIVIGIVTISPRLVVSSSLNSDIVCEGPAASSVDSLLWGNSGEKNIQVIFQSNNKHVSVEMMNIDYNLGVYLEFGLKAFSYEITALSTPSISQTIVSSISEVSIGEYNAIPEADFSFSPTDPTDTDTVTFSDASTDDDGTLVEYLWEFGDGSTDTRKNPSRKFPVGSISVRLTVIDNDGAEDSTTETITILKAPKESLQNIIPGLPNGVLAIIGLLIIILLYYFLFHKK